MSAQYDQCRCGATKQTRSAVCRSCWLQAPSIRRDAELRFWVKVDTSGDCWLWMSQRGDFGYGRFWNGEYQEQAHRWAYRTFVGPIPDGLWVLHHCDTPACVRPSHLFLGTHLDNMADMTAKGRGYKPPRGCRQGHELTPDNRLRQGRYWSCKTCTNARRRAAWAASDGPRLAQRRKRQRIRDATMRRMTSEQWQESELREAWGNR